MIMRKEVHGTYSDDEKAEGRLGVHTRQWQARFMRHINMPASALGIVEEWTSCLKGTPSSW
jgi:hypothetical protein